MGWWPSKRYVLLESVDVNLFGKMVFAGVIKESSPGLIQWALNPLISVLKRREDSDRREGHMKMEAETGVT